MEPDDLLCSRNARSQEALARAIGTSRTGETYLPVGGRVKKSHAMGAHLARLLL